MMIKFHCPVYRDLLSQVSVIAISSNTLVFATACSSIRLLTMLRLLRVQDFRTAELPDRPGFFSMSLDKRRNKLSK